MTFTFQIRNNNIVITCNLNKWSKADHLMPLYMRALDTVFEPLSMSRHSQMALG
jgi:hypothetical protein